jgi:hypothetical protein
MANKFIKDPESVLDYVFDWSSWLASGETISSFTITVPTGLTEGTGATASSQAAGKVTIWLSSGTDGTEYAVECKIVTSSGRTDERTIWIHCMQV